MLTFRSASILMIILAVLVLLLMIALPHFWWLLIPVIIVYLLMLVIGSANIRSGFYLKAFCQGNTSEKIAALTFDDGPDAKNTPLVLDALEKHHIQATFFLIGNKAEKQAELVRLILSKGHNVGFHSYSHDFFFDFFSNEKMEQDLLKAEDIMLKETGKRPLLFRPPYGVTNPTLSKVTKKLGYKVTGWSVRSCDTTIKDAERIAERVIRKLHPGAVVLMHDTLDITPVAVEMIIRKAGEAGYHFVRLEELLGVEAYDNN